MSQSKQALRTRIKSIGSTRKITKAMEMIANAKLLKQRNKMEANREYATKLQDTVNEIAVRNPDIQNDYMKQKTSTKTLTIMFGSDLGLCGSYNQNAIKYAKENLNLEDPIFVIGTSIHHQMMEEGFNVMNEEPISTDDLDFLSLKNYVKTGIDQYLKNEVGTVNVLYTRFVNTMSFEPSIKQLLPFAMDQEVAMDETMHQETLFEPSAEVILDTLIPMMIADVTYACWMEASTAEQGSRRMAMKTATDNADELSDTLKLQYNKARQSAITQEITEIVSGSTAV